MSRGTEIIHFLRRLRAIADAGIPLVDGVRELAGNVRSRRFKKMLRKIAERLEEGEDMENILRSLPEPYRSIKLRSAARMCGGLSDSLGILAELMELDAKFRSGLLYVSAYPLFVFIVLTVSVGMISAHAASVIVPFFESYSVTLSAGTRFVLAAGRNPLILLGAYAGICVAYLAAARLGIIREIWICMRRFVPGLRRMSILETRARLCRALRLMINAEMPIADGMNVLQELCPDAFRGTDGSSIEEGAELWQALPESKIVDCPLRNVLRSGEKAGVLPAVLEEVEKMTLEEVTAQGRRFVYLAGPALLGLVGALVGIVYYLITSPYFKLFSDPHRFL